MNPDSQRFEDRWLRRISRLERYIEQLKTSQPIGADGLSVVSSDLASGSFVLNPGEARTFTTTFAPANHRLQLLEFAASFFIDNDLDLSYLYRSGGSLTTDQLKIRRNDWLDWATSDDGTGVRAYKTLVDNLGASSHTIYYYSRAYFMKGGSI